MSKSDVSCLTPQASRLTHTPQVGVIATNPTCSRLQPYLLEAATLFSRGCDSSCPACVFVCPQARAPSHVPPAP